MVSEEIYIIGRDLESTFSILFFMRILGVSDHWYHLFVAISYHIFWENQVGILYKVNTILLDKEKNVCTMRKEWLTSRR